MYLFKQPRWDSKPWRDGANGQPCIRCGCQDNTVVLAHYQGTGAMRLGKGRGKKLDDFIGADLCQRCHQYFDDYQSANDYERGWEFLLLCFLTIQRRLHQGGRIQSTR